ncbi:MAG: tetratricopeptide repeat protein [Polyangiaceae bacterium]
MDDGLKRLLVLGREHYANKEFDKAEPLLHDILAADDRFADVHDMLGVIAHQRGNFVAAEHHFERAVSLNPNYTEALINLAVTYNDRGKYDKAREVYQRIQGPSGAGSLGSDSFARGRIANMHAEVAQAYHDAGLLREAATEYEKAIALCPQFADIRTRLGTLLRELHEYRLAREHYEAAVAARPTYVPARLQLGVTLLAMGDPYSAEEQWHRVLEADPDNARAKMYLRMLATQKQSGEMRASAPP